MKHVLQPLPSGHYADSARGAVAFGSGGASDLLMVPEVDAASSAGELTVYSVDDSGYLTEVSGSPFALGRSPAGASLSPDGSVFAVTNSDDGTVSVFSTIAVATPG